MTVLIILAIAGLVLIVAEILFIPGTTIIGIFGGILSAYSIFKAYYIYGFTTGNWFLFANITCIVFLMILSFQSSTWDRFANQNKSEGKAIEPLDLELSIGDEGNTLSDLKPSGKAEFKGKVYEVHSLGTYCQHPTRLIIIDINPYKITVQPIT